MILQKLGNMREEMTPQDLEQMERDIQIAMEEDAKQAPDAASQASAAVSIAQSGVSQSVLSQAVLSQPVTSPVAPAAPAVSSFMKTTEPEAKSPAPRASSFLTRQRVAVATDDAQKPAGLMSRLFSPAPRDMQVSPVSLFAGVMPPGAARFRPSRLQDNNAPDLGETSRLARSSLSSPMSGVSLTRAALPRDLALPRNLVLPRNLTLSQLLKSELGQVRRARENAFDSLSRLLKGLAAGDEDAENFANHNPDIAAKVLPAKTKAPTAG